VFVVRCPAGFGPPVAPREAPAPFPLALAAGSTVRPAPPPAVAAVFVTVPPAPPAAELTPPIAPRPPAMPEPAAEPLRPPIVSISSPAIDGPPCAEASA